MRLKRGFTLIEVMVVMAIISVLAALAIGAITITRHTQEETIHRGNAKNLQTGLETFFAKNRSYCSVVYTAGGGPVCDTSTSFTKVAEYLKSTGIDVSLKPTKCDTGTAVFNLLFPKAFAITGGGGGNNSYGGGTVLNLQSNSYKLLPGNWDCSSTMDDDAISI